MIEGTDQNDQLVGTDSDDVIYGRWGNDTIKGGFGADVIDGGAGDDTIAFRGALFTYPAPPNGQIIGGEGFDTLDATDIGADEDNLVGTANSTQVNLIGSTRQFYIGNQMFLIDGIEVIRLGPGADAISMSAAGSPLAIYTGEGADSIQVYPSVSVYAEGGDDAVFISATFGGPQTVGMVDGGTGSNTLTTNVGFTVDLMAGTAVAGETTWTTSNFQNVTAAVSFSYDATVRGDASNNVLTASSSFGDAGRVLLDGRGGDDVLVGEDNSDELRGGEGRDQLEGKGGADHLFGGGGDDVLRGDAGADLIDGGDGRDTAVFDLTFLPAQIVAGGASYTVYGDSLTHVEVLKFSDGQIELSDANGLVDDLFYASRYQDVYRAGVDADLHYDQYGWKEGRDPDALFSTSGYLAANGDVRSAGINPLDHYRVYGFKEGRDPSAGFDSEQYLARNPDVAAAGVNPLEHYLTYGKAEGRLAYAAVGPSVVGGFDAEFYLLANNDVARAGVDALTHYVNFGLKEGRDPDAYFDTSYYLEHNPDVAAAGVDPLRHYWQYGWKEGRDPSAHFDTSAYLALNGDVAAAGMNPLEHYLEYGRLEGRVIEDAGWMV